MSVLSPSLITCSQGLTITCCEGLGGSIPQACEDTVGAATEVDLVNLPFEANTAGRSLSQANFLRGLRGVARCLRHRSFLKHVCLSLNPLWVEFRLSAKLVCSSIKWRRVSHSSSTTPTRRPLPPELVARGLRSIALQHILQEPDKLLGVAPRRHFLLEQSGPARCTEWQKPGPKCAG